MPGIVEAAATKPIHGSGVLRLFANKERTGFFDMVELRIANSPTVHNKRKKLFVGFHDVELPMILQPELLFPHLLSKKLIPLLSVHSF